ncbi:hypothetical protein O3P69_009427 [Scylla paramamosain]|uniref:CUB domain-containing protein n=1 Tax=Scylla paramamosain TaxID=85552 RepID=A0AAW0STP3_SCYPA
MEVDDKTEGNKGGSADDGSLLVKLNEGEAVYNEDGVTYDEKGAENDNTADFNDEKDAYDVATHNEDDANHKEKEEAEDDKKHDYNEEEITRVQDLLTFDGNKLANNEDKTAGSEDNMAGSEDNTAGSEDNMAGSEDNTAGSEDNTAGSEDNMAGSEDNTAGSEDNTAGSEDNTTGSEDNTTGSEDNTAGSEDNMAGSEDNTTGSEDKTAGSEDNTAGSEDNTAGSEDTAGSKDNTAGSEDKTAGSEDNTAGSEDKTNYGQDKWNEDKTPGSEDKASYSEDNPASPAEEEDAALAGGDTEGATLEYESKDEADEEPSNAGTVTETLNIKYEGDAEFNAMFPNYGAETQDIIDHLPDQVQNPNLGGSVPNYAEEKTDLSEVVPEYVEENPNLSEAKPDYVGNTDLTESLPDCVEKNPDFSESVPDYGERSETENLSKLKDAVPIGVIRGGGGGGGGGTEEELAASEGGGGGGEEFSASGAGVGEEKDEEGGVDIEEVRGGGGGGGGGGGDAGTAAEEEERVHGVGEGGISAPVKGVRGEGIHLGGAGGGAGAEGHSDKEAALPAFLPDGPFFINLPGTPNAVPVFLTVEPVRVNYVPADQEGGGEGEEEDVGGGGIAERVSGEDKIDTQKEPQETGGEKVDEDEVVKEEVEEEVEEGSPSREIPASTSSSFGSLMNGIYRILDDASAAINEYTNTQSLPHHPNHQYPHPPSPTTTPHHPHHQYQQENQWKATQLKEKLQETKYRLETHHHLEEESEGHKEAPHESSSFVPSRTIPDPFFLMEAPQLGTPTASPEKPPVSEDAETHKGEDYAVQVTSKFGIDTEEGQGGGDKGTVKYKGTVEDVSPVRNPARGAVQNAGPMERQGTDEGAEGTEESETGVTEGDVNVTASDPDLVYGDAASLASHSLSSPPSPSSYTFSTAHTPIKHDAFQGLNLDMLTNRVFQLLTPPPPSQSEDRLNPQYTPFPITTNPPRTTPPATTVSHLPSMEFSPIPEADFEDAFSPAALPEAPDGENAIVEAVSPPRVIGGTPVFSAEDNSIRRVSAAPLRIADEGLYGAPSQATKEALTEEGEGAGGDGGDGGGAGGHGTDLTAHKQVWSFPQSREETPWMPATNTHKEEMKEEQQQEEEQQEEEEEEEDVALPTPRVNFSPRKYTAFNSASDIPGISPLTFSRRLALEGKDRPTTWMEDSVKDTPAAHHPIGPEYYQYLKSLPPNILMSFLQPRAMRARRAAPEEGEHIFCEWNIKTEPGLYLLLTFHNLSAAYSVDCKGAYIEVERENNGYDARWCGTRVSPRHNRPHVIFAKSEVRVTVFDDGDETKETPTGFTADVEGTEGDPDCVYRGSEGRM